MYASPIIPCTATMSIGYWRSGAVGERSVAEWWMRMRPLLLGRFFGWFESEVSLGFCGFGGGVVLDWEAAERRG